ncbi:MAG: glycosyltransferase family 9 protein, partial [Deltaproteobacteria bacterium]|nr:glycosyltransferase family 9 protein [Deltaproteobacteria bacterium]
MKILIIQILRMGDALQLLPLIKGIKRLFPKSEICLLTSHLEKSVFDIEPDIAAIYTLNKETISTLVSRGSKADVISALEQLENDLAAVSDIEWDWVINFSHTFSSALLGFILNAKYRSGFKVDDRRRYRARERWFAYSLASFPNRRYSNFNWGDINNNVIGLDSIPHPPFIEPNRLDIVQAKEFFNQTGFANEKIAGIHPGASVEYKMWPVEKFAELSRILINNHGYKILIFGNLEGKHLSNRLKQMIGRGAENLAGKTSLEELTAFLSLCDVLITNDTGPMHLASAVNTRTIGLFFTTHFIETGPYGAGHVAIHPNISCFPCQGPARCLHKDCLQYISPETVEAVIANRGVFEKNGSTDFLKSDRGKVKVFVSDFDPWGNLEWLPLERRPIGF